MKSRNATGPGQPGRIIIGLTVALVLVGGVAIWARGGAEGGVGATPATTVDSVASTTTEPAIIAVTTTPSSTSTSTTTSTVVPTSTMRLDATELPASTAVSAPPTTSPPPTTALVNNVPVWPQYLTQSGLVGVAALTGEPVEASVTERPIVAVKIDNHRRARPQWGLDEADVIIEENVEGVTRFVALFHTRLPDRVGPVRSARTGDLDLLAAMNRPILGWSGGNRGVTNWVESSASAGMLVNFSAQKSPCYNRTSSRSAPHNLLLDPACAIRNASDAGAARPLFEIDGAWTVADAPSATPDTTFDVEMDGVNVSWTWDTSTESYLRSQDGRSHVAQSGARIAAQNVVEVYSFHAPSPVDARSPNPITIGGTTAVIHRNGVAIVGTWYRETPYNSFRFYESATGGRVPLDTGTTFIELVRDR